jgi:hypothetical protein
MAARLVLACALLAYAFLGITPAPAAELSRTEMDKLMQNELIVHSREIPKRPWPEITIFGVIDVVPAEAAALFSNYQDQKKYIPDLIKSDPVKKIGARETIVDFEMRTPWPLSNSKYSTGNVFKMSENNEYEIAWYLVESDSLVDSKGAVNFMPFGKKTLFKYKSLIHPDSKLASIFSSKAKSGMFKTVQAIVSYIEETKRTNPEKVQKLVNLLPK